MSCKVDFPTTPEAFVSYHEAMMGHAFPPSIRVVLAEYVEFLNIAFEEGRAGKEQTLIRMDDIQAFYSSRGEMGFLSRDHIRDFFQWVCDWCDRAYQAGKELEK